MSLPQMIRERQKQWSDNVCFRVKRDGVYEDILWSEYADHTERLTTAFIGWEMAPGDRLAIYAPTRYEWALCDTAILSAGCITVPLYPNLGPEEAKDLISRSRSAIVFVADQEGLDNVLDFCDELDFLKKIVCFDADIVKKADREDVICLWDIIDSTEPDTPAVEARLANVGTDDIATIIFTSGTTGEPKGVQLSHGNILTNVKNAMELFELGLGDVCLSHLPLAHIFERMAGYYLMLYKGVIIAYAESLQTVAADLAIVKPTICVSVPRIFEKIFAGIQAKAVASPAPIRMLTFWAIEVAQKVGGLRNAGKSVPGHLALQFKVADKLVYSKVRAKFGGRLKLFVSGGAPLAPELALFFGTIGIPVMEGYGLTETSPVIAVNTFEKQRIGTVGVPMKTVECKIADDGEILVKGPSIFKAYYENEAATREAFNDDGWFMTGDIGEFDSDGYLKITDRKKDLIITAAGKNVAPQKIENVLKMDKYIAEAMLHGDKKRFVSALIVPDFEWLARYAEWKKIAHTDNAELVKNPAVLDFYTRRIEKLQADAHLASYESVKKFVLLDHEFSADGGEVTPTMKIRRKQITEHYRNKIEALYEEE